MNQNIFAKSILVFGAWIVLVTAFALWPVVVTAQEEPDYTEVNELAKQLNCPTCAGINLSDCRTLTCQQWRDQISSLLQEGYSDQEVLDYFVTRYGTQVLQEPPRSGFTLWLWILPFIIVLGGGGWLYYVLRGWSRPQKAAVTAAPSAVSAPPQSNDDYLNLVDQDLGVDET